MVEKKKKGDKPETSSKADVLKAVEELPKASNLVVDNVKYETVKRDDVIALINKML
jgi:hypothetical protein